MEHLQKYITKAFEVMVRGNFVSANSVHQDTRKLYEMLETHYEYFAKYFRPLGFLLEAGDNYFYFARQEPRKDLEDKVRKFYEYIDYLAFFSSYDPMFGEGTRFSIADIEQRCKVDTHLREQLVKLAAERDTQRERIRRLVREMQNKSFFECENEEEERYKVLSSYHYLLNIVNLIDIDYQEEYGKVSE